ncbi:ABC transporter ATP-binding protein [Pendulispora albinea]|uniref:ABC transporter ATP-binding protein n=1 Tax=Pendulispora albinea TaxID=2741071 RepID=A0ABZ2LQW2_9BACT
MARIELRGISHTYAGGAPALKPLDLVWEDGGAYALLGPSGCGKTTLLNIISGLLRPTKGEVLIDGKGVTHAPPEARNIAQVFQFPVVYDTMTVFDNLAFPLRNRRVKESEIRPRVEQIADLLEMTNELGRRARGLSADALQKISLGRGLVRKDVAAILFDEPLTVIDPHAKWLLRRKLKQIHQTTPVTLVYVTHDQVEALTLADKVVVMNEGSVVQQGSPEDLFERPAHTFVGHFIGSPGMNFLPCTLEGDDGAARVGNHRIPVDPAQCARARALGGSLVLGVRPEFLRRVEPETAGAVPTTVRQVEELGTHVIASATLRQVGAQEGGQNDAQQELKVKLPEGTIIAAGDTLWLELSPSRTTLYADGRAAFASSV